MKAHIGVDADSGLVHSVVGTAASVNDVTQAGALLHGQEKSAFGDAGYRGADSVPVSEQLSAEVLSIPIFPELTAEQRQWVAASLADFAAGKTA